MTHIVLAKCPTSLAAILAQNKNAWMTSGCSRLMNRQSRSTTRASIFPVPPRDTTRTPRARNSSATHPPDLSEHTVRSNLVRLMREASSSTCVSVPPIPKPTTHKISFSGRMIDFRPRRVRGTPIPLSTPPLGHPFRTLPRVVQPVDKDFTPQRNPDWLGTTGTEMLRGIGQVTDHLT